MDISLKAKQIKLIITDIDGVLTDGGIYINDDGCEGRKFNSVDGVGILMCHRANLAVAAISGSGCRSIETRLKYLKVEHIYLAKISKLASYEDLKNKLSLTNTQIAYIGDDIIDIDILMRVGLAATVSNSSDVVKKYTHYETKKSSGNGAFREFAEFILHKQNKLEQTIDKFITKK